MRNQAHAPSWEDAAKVMQPWYTYTPPEWGGVMLESWSDADPLEWWRSDDEEPGQNSLSK